jgi:DNA-binding NtrC family response regulator
LSDDPVKAMLAYDWPGNVRELERELETCLDRACALHTGPVIHLADLPGAISGAESKVPASGEPSSKIVAIVELEKQTILDSIALPNGDKLLAARLLGIGKTYRKLKEYAVAR